MNTPICKGGAELFGIATPPLTIMNDELMIESQAANGLSLWSEHFASMIWAMPCTPTPIAMKQHSVDWVPVRDIATNGRFSIVPLPRIYDLEFVRKRSQIAAKLREILLSTRYCHFGLGGWNGSWGRVAAHSAAENSIPFALHLETVQSSVAWESATSLRQKLKCAIYGKISRRSDAFLLRRAAIVQCNGMDTFEHYRSISKNAVIIHDIHTKDADLIDKSGLHQKIARVQKHRPLQIRYAGRLIGLKGPMDWIKALAIAHERGAKFDAQWMGEGELKPAFISEIKRLGLSEHIALVPFEKNRLRVVQFLRDADILLFTHLSLESSRVQKESLNQGTPIVGYTTLYAEELISVAGGGLMCPMRDPVALGELIVNLYRDRRFLADLISRASIDGQRFTAKRVFSDRAVSIRLAIDSERTIK